MTLRVTPVAPASGDADLSGSEIEGKGDEQPAERFAECVARIGQVRALDMEAVRRSVAAQAAAGTANSS